MSHSSCYVYGHTSLEGSPSYCARLIKHQHRRGLNLRVSFCSCCCPSMVFLGSQISCKVMCDSNLDLTWSKQHKPDIWIFETKDRACQTMTCSWPRILCISKVWRFHSSWKVWRVRKGHSFWTEKHIHVHVFICDWPSCLFTTWYSTTPTAMILLE